MNTNSKVYKYLDKLWFKLLRVDTFDLTLVIILTSIIFGLLYNYSNIVTIIFIVALLIYVCHRWICERPDSYDSY